MNEDLNDRDRIDAVVRAAALAAGLCLVIIGIVVATGPRTYHEPLDSRVASSVKSAVPEVTGNDRLSRFLRDGDPKDLPQRFSFPEIRFDPDTTRLTSSSLPLVDRMAEILKTNPSVEAWVEGYADRSPLLASNQRLSLDQALSVRSRLVADGVEPSRLKAVGSQDVQRPPGIELVIVKWSPSKLTR